jgi:putative transposase
MINFIDDHRGSHGVEPICRVLPIAPSTYHDHVAKRADPEKLSARAKRDEILKPEIARVFAENFEVYGARKVWRQLKRESRDVARCTVERLMHGMGLHGVIRGKHVKTTVSDKARTPGSWHFLFMGTFGCPERLGVWTLVVKGVPHEHAIQIG